MSGELLFVSLGLGHTLMMGRELADMSQVLSVIIVIIGLGLLTDRAIFGVIFEVNVYNYPDDVVSAHELEDLVKSLLPEQRGWDAAVPALAE